MLVYTVAVKTANKSQGVARKSRARFKSLTRVFANKVRVKWYRRLGSVLYSMLATCHLQLATYHWLGNMQAYSANCKAIAKAKAKADLPPLGASTLWCRRDPSVAICGAQSRPLPDCNKMLFRFRFRFPSTVHCPGHFSVASSRPWRASLGWRPKRSLNFYFNLVLFGIRSASLRKEWLSAWCL